MPLQPVRSLDVELPDAGVVVVDPDLGAGETGVRALWSQSDGVSGATSHGRRAGGADGEARPWGIQKLLGGIYGERISPGVWDSHNLAGRAAGKIKPQRRSVGRDAISALEIYAQQIRLLSENDAARGLRAARQRISECLPKFGPHAVQGRVSGNGAIDDRVSVLRSRNWRHGDDERRGEEECFHNWTYPAGLMPFLLSLLEHCGQSPRPLRAARPRAE